MKRSKLSRNLTSFSLILATFTFFSLTAYATPNLNNANLEPMFADDGTLTASGSVSINGNAVKTGATVTSGSTVAVGADGIAVIDLPALGRVTVGPSTSATITFSSSGIMVKTTCSDMRVTVNRGSATVTSASVNKTLTAGQNEYFTSPVDVNATVGSDVAVNCGTAVICGVGAIPAAGGFPSYLGVGLLGLLLLGGTATAVTVGVISGGGSRPRVSPSQP